jgi:hypothetical protein
LKFLDKPGKTKADNKKGCVRNSFLANNSSVKATKNPILSFLLLTRLAAGFGPRSPTKILWIHPILKWFPRFWKLIQN